MSYPNSHVFRTLVLSACLLTHAALADTPKATEYKDPHANELPRSPALNLHATVEKTYLRNPNLQVLSARLGEADALRQQSESFFASDPSVIVDYTNDQMWSDVGYRQWQTGISLPLWWPGQKSARRNVATQAELSAGASAEALRLTVAGLVRESLWAVAIKENQMEIAMREWEIARRLEVDVEKRVRLGDLARTDLILTQQETLGKRTALVRAQADHRHAVHIYQAVTGLDALPAKFNEEPSSRAQLEERHPLLEEAHAEVERAMAEREKSRGEKRGNPTLTLGPRNERGSRDSDYTNSLEVVLNVPLGLSSQAAPRLAAAELVLAEAQGKRDTLKRQLEIQLDEALHDLDATRTQLSVIEQQNKLAQENLALNRKAFALGEIDLVSMIRVQTQAFTAERTLQQKQLELGLHIARVNQALGVIP
jgi:outer membrane protein TolC